MVDRNKTKNIQNWIHVSSRTNLERRTMMYVLHTNKIQTNTYYVINQHIVIVVVRIFVVHNDHEHIYMHLYIYIYNVYAPRSTTITVTFLSHVFSRAA